MTSSRKLAGKRHVSLSRFIVSRILLYILPIVTAVTLLHWHFEKKLLTEVFDDALRDRAMTLATLITADDGIVELEFADEFMPQYSRAERPYFFQIWRSDGSLLEKSPSLGRRELPRRIGSPEKPICFSTDLPDAGTVRAVGIEFPVRLGTDPSVNPIVRVAVVVAADGGLLRQRLATGFVYVIFTGLALGCGVTVVVLAALRRASRLLQRVADEVADLDRFRLEQRIDVDAAPLEIQPILATLNDSLDTISKAMERESRFTSDVAHELRTPIAELRTATEVAMRWPGGREATEVIHEAHEIAVQMSAMVDSLLQLSRLEGMSMEQESEDLDLAELVRSQLERVSKLRERPADRVRVVEKGSSAIRGNRSLWEVVVGNLLDNALEHSPEGSPVEVELDGERRRIRVRNDSSEPLPADLTQATKRLWRADSARAEPDHFGLGLSIVEAACNKLGVVFSLEADGGRFLASVMIPGERNTNRVA